MKKAARQIIKYGLVGIMSNLVGYLCYLLITNWGMEIKMAMTLVYAVGASVGFFGNRKWTFAHGGNSTKAALSYVLAHLSGYLLNFTILLIFADHLGYAHQWVQAVAIFIVAGFLFMVFKYFVFREHMEHTG